MSDSEDLILSQKTWNRSIDAIEKDGFREGFQVGRDNCFQNGFDIGYKTGFELYFDLVFKETKMRILQETAASYTPPEDHCVICLDKNTDITELSLETIIEKQKESLSLS